MIKAISLSLHMVIVAQTALLILLSMFLVLHSCILLKIIPYDLVWGGRLKSVKEMYRFEIVSVLINFLFLFVVLMRANYLVLDIPKAIITYGLWLMTCLFLINTLGNAVSKNKLEQRIFAPLTVLMAVFSAILALSHKI